MHISHLPRFLCPHHVCLFVLVLISGCSTTHAPAPIAYPQTAPEDVPVFSQQTAEQGIQKSTLTPITSLSSPPARPQAGLCASSAIESSADDGVMIQGKAYVRRTLPEIYRDLTTPEITGPRHMTNDFVMDAFVETPLETSYTLHVKMRYILSIEFDLEWRIEPVFDNGKHVGYVAQTHKTAGTRYITEITNRIHAIETEPGLFEIEMTSFNRASMNKEEEAKAYVVGLFDYWAQSCHHAYGATDDAGEISKPDIGSKETDHAVSDESDASDMKESFDHVL